MCVAEASSTKHPSLWKTIPLTRRDSDPVKSLQTDPEWYSATFAGKLDLKSLGLDSHLKFTVKYRLRDTTPWQWLCGQGQNGVPEGQLIQQTSIDEKSGADHLINLEKGWNTVEIATSTQNAVLFSLETGPPFPSNQLQRTTLGSISYQARSLAFTRLEPPWMGPRHGGDFLHLSEPTMVCSVLRKDGNVVTILAPCVDDIYMVFETDEEGKVVVAAKADRATEKPLRVLLSVGKTIEVSIEAIMLQLREEANKSHLVSMMTRESEKLNFSHDMDSLLDNLGFCTWNAMGLDLTQDGMLKALRTLSGAGVNISTFLIDDGWHDVGETERDFSNPQFRGLAHYKAPASKLPGGLDGLVRDIRGEFPLVREIGVWHALLGYWGAIAKQGYIADNYDCWDVDGKLYYAEDALMKVVSPMDAQRFYNDFYVYLAESGITFIKTDVQNVVSDIKDPSVRSKLIPAYQSAWTIAHQRYLGGKAISCMSQVPEHLFRLLLQTYTPPMIVRNSDDFFPEIPSSHTWHIWTNAHNALVCQHLNAVLDWDMFQTSHAFGRLHGASRCLSGGPLLLTDIPGDHDLGLINEMVAEAPDGRSIALRPKGMGKAGQAWDGIEKGVLKIVNEASAGAKFLGVFNVGETDRSVMVSIAEFANIGQSWKQDAEVVVLSHEMQKVLGPIKLGSTSTFQSDPSSLIKIDLKATGCDILSAFEATRLNTANGEILVSVLGLMGKMTGAAGVSAFKFLISNNNKLVASLKLKALGTVGIWVHGIKLQGRSIKATLQGHEVPVNIRKPSESDSEATIVTLDLLNVWKERTGKGTPKEVSVEALFDL